MKKLYFIISALFIVLAVFLLQERYMQESRMTDTLVEDGSVINTNFTDKSQAGVETSGNGLQSSAEDFVRSVETSGNESGFR